LIKARLRSILPPSVAVLATGNALSIVIYVSALPILSGMYTPNEFGAFAIWLTVLSAVTLLAGLRLEIGIVSAGSTEDANSLARAIVQISSYFCSALLVGAILLIPVSARFPAVSPTIILLTPIATWFNVLQTVGYRLNNRNQNFKRMTIAKSAGSLAGVTIQILGAIVTPSAETLVLGFLVGLITNTMIQSFGHWRVVTGLASNSTRSARHLIRDRAAMIRFLLPSQILAVTSAPIATASVGAAGGLALVGFFAAGQRIFGAPTQVIGQAANDVYFERLSRLSRNRLEIRTITLRSLLVMSFVGTWIAVGGFSLAPYVVTRFLGPAWQDATSVLQATAVLYGLGFAVAGIDSGAWALGRYRYSLAWQAARLVLGLVVLQLAVLNVLNNEEVVWGIVCYATALNVAYAFYMLSISSASQSQIASKPTT